MKPARIAVGVALSSVLCAASAAASPAAAAPLTPTIGAPVTFGGLTLYPLSEKDQASLPAFVTLDAALAARTASVREPPEATAAGSGPNGDSETGYNSLLVENDGEVPVYALAGTIVTGGLQDRQLADDYVVGPHQTISAAVYCVEDGRWATDRDGVDTGGRFSTVGLLTDARARTAAQLERDQSAVWAEVASVNDANGKVSDTSALMASLGAADLSAKRSTLAAALQSDLAGLEPSVTTVGFAYAVDGELRGARWFSSHKVFTMFEPELLATAAMEAVTPLGATHPPASTDDVSQLIATVAKGDVDEARGSGGESETDVRQSSKSYGVTTLFRPASPTAPEVPLGFYAAPR